MTKTTIYLPDDLADQIDEDRDPGESRSEWIQKAAQRELKRDPTGDRLADLERRVADLEDQGLLGLLRQSISPATDRRRTNPEHPPEVGRYDPTEEEIKQVLDDENGADK